MESCEKMANPAPPLVHNVVRFTVGVILLTAAGLKGYQVAAEPVVGAGILESRWFLAAVVEFELLFGLWLLAGLWPAHTWKAAIVCFSLFAGISLVKGMSGDVSCGCFGRVSVNPWYTFSLDAVIVVSLVRFPPCAHVYAANKSRRYALLRTALTAIIWMAVGVPAAISMREPHVMNLTDSKEVPVGNAIMILEPRDWIGKRFPLLKYIDIGDRLMTGGWIVVVVHHDCPECQEVMSRCVSASGGSGSRGSLSRSFAFVEMPPYGSDPLVPSSYLVGRLDDEHAWFCNTPQAIRLADGNVVETGVGI